MHHSVQWLGYGVDDRGIGARFRARKEVFLYSKCFNRSWDPSSFLPTVWRGTFPRIKLPKPETDRCDAEVKNAWRYSSTPLYALVTRWLILQRDNWTCTFTNDMWSTSVVTSRTETRYGRHERFEKNAMIFRILLYCTLRKTAGLSSPRVAKETNVYRG